MLRREVGNNCRGCGLVAAWICYIVFLLIFSALAELLIGCFVASFSPISCFRVESWVLNSSGGLCSLIAVFKANYILWCIVFIGSVWSAFSWKHTANSKLVMFLRSIVVPLLLFGSFVPWVWLFSFLNQEKTGSLRLGLIGQLILYVLFFGQTVGTIYHDMRSLRGAAGAGPAVPVVNEQSADSESVNDTQSDTNADSVEMVGEHILQ